MAQIDETTLVPIGFIAGVGFAIWRGVAWILGLNAKVDVHTSQLNNLQEEVKHNTEIFSDVTKLMSEQSERLVRVEERINFIAETIKQ